jgi:3-deoxy-D-manno-octulosonate 8-phosphate phosphatase (KDO 8-P phosphatase)
LKEILSLYPKPLIKKAEAVKALVFDVDGVLTDGKITYDDSGREIKSFNVRDGQIIAHLKNAGIIVGIISGRESETVSRRANELRLEFCHQGIVDKATVFEKIADFHKLKKKHVAYIGDDINDIGILKIAGFPVCPADAPAYVRKYASMITRSRGGEGVVREVGDLLLASRGLLAKIVGSQ